jgi:hypothetical protein
VSLQEIEQAVSHLSSDQLALFAKWFEEYLAEKWDREIESDIHAGKLQDAGQKAITDFNNGQCKPL